MGRSTGVSVKGSDWPPEQTLRVLRQQLEKLRGFGDKTHTEVENEETAWKQLTEGVLIHGFGEGSHNVSHYYSARSAGIWNTRGVSEFQRQENYKLRIAKFEATLLSSIAELEASLPEVATREVYGAGDDFAFYKDLKEIITRAETEIFVVDNYLNTEFFELYVATVQSAVRFHILTNEVRGNLEAVARKYANSHAVELRTGPDVHDRHIFVDDRCWNIGQSIKDAAKKKPTYMVELSPSLVPVMRKVYLDIWARAIVVVKS